MMQIRNSLGIPRRDTTSWTDQQWQDYKRKPRVFFEEGANKVAAAMARQLLLVQPVALQQRAFHLVQTLSKLTRILHPPITKPKLVKKIKDRGCGQF